MNQIKDTAAIASILIEEAETEKTSGALTANFWRKNALKLAHAYKELARSYNEERDRRERLYNRLMAPCAPVFYIRDETDCDQYRVRNVGRAPSYYAFLLLMERAYRNREGRLSFDEITAEEYAEAIKQEPYHQDLAAEAAGY